MYTQCPECDVAFRVTAEVLKVAAGRVRCGNCAAAFNALEHLSEAKPVANEPATEAYDPDAEDPTTGDTVIIQADIPPETITAAESAALMRTLDDLAVEDIRIEDTGVEWRVVDDIDLDPPAEPTPPAQDEPSRDIDEMLFDDNTVLPDDFDAVVDATSEAKPVEPPPPAEPESPQVEVDLSEPDEWDDLLDDLEEPREADEADEADEAGEFAALEEPDAHDEPEELAELESRDTLGDADDTEEPEEIYEFDELDDVDVTREAAELAEELDEDELERSIEEDLLAAAFESEASAKAPNQLAAAAESADEDEDFPDDVEIDIQIEDDLETDDDVEDIAMRFDDTIEEDIATLSMSMNEDPFESLDEPTESAVAIDDEAEEYVDDESAAGEAESGEHVIPEMTEEEKTINMMIDQDLLAIAVEDEDGFASTIVQIQPDDDAAAEARKKDAKAGDKASSRSGDQRDDADVDQGVAEMLDPDPSAKVETIIMEGEFVRSDIDNSEFSLNRDKDDYARRGEVDSHGPGRGMIAGIAVLAVVLLLQVMHQSRNALATVPAFNSAMGPAYRMLGMPLTPSWNIAGWRFEVTQSDIDDNGELLTIFSRVGNNGDEPLPYPLVHVSLTDRFEDVIGSTVLDPADYLPEDSDPRTMVPPGNTFNAVIEIESPSADATGFKLNVCYRLASGQLRCADHDFK